MNNPPALNVRHRSPEDIAVEIRAGAYGDLNQLVTLAMAMRQASDDAERDNIVFLRAREISEVWAQTDDGTYLRFLERNHIITPARYQQGCRTLQVIPATTIDVISFASAQEVAKIADEPRREEALCRVRQWAAANGRPPSPQTTREIAGVQNPRLESPQARRIRELDAENNRLRADVDRLRGLVVSLGGNPDAGAQAAE